MSKIVRETIHKNSRRIWGYFKLSDGTKTEFEQTKENAKNGVSWFQWGNSRENLGLTVERVEQLTREWLESIGF